MSDIKPRYRIQWHYYLGCIVGYWVCNNNGKSTDELPPCKYFTAYAFNAGQIR